MSESSTPKKRTLQQTSTDAQNALETARLEYLELERGLLALGYPSAARHAVSLARLLAILSAEGRVASELAKKADAQGEAHVPHGYQEAPDGRPELRVVPCASYEPREGLSLHLDSRLGVDHG